MLASVCQSEPAHRTKRLFPLTYAGPSVPQARLLDLHVSKNSDSYSLPGLLRNDLLRNYSLMLWCWPVLILQHSASADLSQMLPTERSPSAGESSPVASQAESSPRHWPTPFTCRSAPDAGELRLERHLPRSNAPRHEQQIFDGCCIVVLQLTIVPG
uniref:(northern house mosquito) hypothetical protein n=1 Tax=Culex pipiens TaxID=7175 RepID=A0A8D8H8L3_CULPI